MGVGRGWLIHLTWGQTFKVDWAVPRMILAPLSTGGCEITDPSVADLALHHTDFLGGCIQIDFFHLLDCQCLYYLLYLKEFNLQTGKLL